MKSSPNNRRLGPGCRGILVMAMWGLTNVALAGVLPARIDPAEADPDWHIDADAGAPAHPAYTKLLDAFTRYRAVLDDGGWGEIAEGADLRIGQRDPRVATIRSRLRLTGDFTAHVEADPHFFDTGMDDAVRKFQRRHRLRADGIVGEQTRLAMNVPVQQRVVQIAVALERWAWLPRHLGDEYIWVNVPESRLVYTVDEQERLSMPVIVGHPDRPTPSFKSELRQLVFNPTWTVPLTIAVEDLLPRQINDPGFLDRNGIRVYHGAARDPQQIPAGDVAWAELAADRFPYVLVQDPGPSNSLGRVKFVMDNPFDVYLHDSPAWRLFYLSARTLSSGCVRLADAPALVQELMQRDRELAQRDVKTLLGPGRTLYVDLERPVPVYIVYFTTWVDADDQLYFARDVYRRDETLTRLLPTFARN